MSNGNPIVIVGSGLAGYTVAREFRKLDKETPLLVVTADDGCFYSKPMLSNALAAGKSAASLAMKTSAAMSQELGAEIVTLTTVSAINAAEHRITAGEREIPYARLVLALGADPIRLPLAGDGAGDVLSVNDLAGYGQLRERLVDKQRIAILGAGLIGCEFANDLLLGKHEVDVIDIAMQPLGRLLPPAPAEAIRTALADAGVRWHFGKKTTTVDKSKNAYRIAFEDGGSVEADLVLSAIGLAPRITLAAAAKLSVNRGIVVDGQLRSSDPDIFALGDCAEAEGSVLPFVLPIMSAARVLGPVLAGKESVLRYPVMPVVVKTPAMPTVVCPAPAGTKGDWKIDAAPGGIIARFIDQEGRIAGFALTGTATTQRQQLLKEMAPV